MPSVARHGAGCLARGDEGQLSLQLHCALCSSLPLTHFPHLLHLFVHVLGYKLSCCCYSPIFPSCHWHTHSLLSVMWVYLFQSCFVGLLCHCEDHLFYAEIL